MQASDQSALSISTTTESIIITVPFAEDSSQSIADGSNNTSEAIATLHALSEQCAKPSKSVEQLVWRRKLLITTNKSLEPLLRVCTSTSRLQRLIAASVAHSQACQISLSQQNKPCAAANQARSAAYQARSAAYQARSAAYQARSAATSLRPQGTETRLSPTSSNGCVSPVFRHSAETQVHSAIPLSSKVHQTQVQSAIPLSSMVRCALDLSARRPATVQHQPPSSLPLSFALLIQQPRH